MIDVLLFFLGASLFLYVVMGGADYGAGILELLPIRRNREDQKHLINKAMGPVWEANHMWLILVVVILFMGFPAVFTTLMTSLHLPMVALLMGIVVRGCAFTFRHYDAIQDPRSQKIYTAVFGVSSLWTALWLGILVASLHRGAIDPNAKDAFTAYVLPWWGFYPLVTGVFVAVIFAFLASIYLVGETNHEDLKRLFLRRAFYLNVGIVVMGALVFLAADAEGGNLRREFLGHPLAVAAVGVATLLFVLLWFVIKKHEAFATRVISAGQIACILAGWFLIYFPNALKTREGPLSFYEAAAPPATLLQLVLALLVGSVFIFPSLFYLLKIFKSSKA
jgi:cytochrome d ubiquinol oxidase subunit II